MLGRLASLTVQVVESALMIVGIRIGTEEPSHTSEPLADNVELRRYGPRIAAETIVAADEDAARSEGFRRLAGYIFGRNHGSDAIAMTAPVGQSKAGQSIAMTAPVAQSTQPSDGDTGWVIRFFMPSKWTMQTLPVPDDDRVRLIEVPAETFVVLTFTGDRGPDALKARTAELRESLRAYGIEATGDPTAWFYDPPWTLPFRRRNEIAIPVSA
ncbi:heme-binding protein [Mycolicibacterium sp. 624]|uniref:SOUL family heme-binding protein n=1 Tax=Mycolicibacterium sp. 624 TaxID=3156314 RepID=UPI003392F20F